MARVADQLGINRETLHDWVSRAEIGAGDRPGPTTDQAQRLAKPEREVQRAASDRRDPEVGLGFPRHKARPPTHRVVASTAGTSQRPS